MRHMHEHHRFNAKGPFRRAASACLLMVLLPVLSRAATWTPATAADLTNALNNCALGDTIVLQAGTTYTGTFVLPNKTTGSGWITIQSSKMSALPPPGRRIQASDAANMPKLRAPSGGPTSTRVIKTALSAHHYKLMGLEIIGPADDSAITALIDLGDSTSAQNTLALCANNLVVDRCYIRANSTTQLLRRGIALNSASTDILNSYIAECHDVGSGDSQAIGGWNGPGPYNIVNNRLEGASENILFGGSPSHIPNVVPSDILISRNHLIKPLEWRGVWSQVKNLFELKAARNVTIDGNIFENCWTAAQTAIGISIKVALESPWHTTENVTFTNNIVRHCGIGLALQGRDYIAGGGTVSNLTFRNNLFDDINGATWGGGGVFIRANYGCPDTTVDHNTVMHTGTVINVDSADYPWNGFVYTNNVHAHNTYGVKGTGTATGNATINLFFPGATFTKNVLMGGNANSYNQYPGNWFPSSWSGVLVNQANPGADYGGYKVVAGSVYDNGGTDGKDAGCDVEAVLAATAGCLTGVWPNPTQTVTLKNGVNGYAGATSFMASGSSPTTHHGASRYHTDSNKHGGTTSYVYRSFFKFNLSSIPSGSTIESATLKVKVEFAGAATPINAYRVAPVNNAFTVNYAAATRNSPLGTATTWTGGTNAGGAVSDANNDYLDTPDDSVSSPSGGVGWINLDVTSSVQAWVSGTPNNGWIVMPAPGGSNIIIYLGTPADLHGSGDYPELEIIYH